MTGHVLLQIQKKIHAHRVVVPTQQAIQTRAKWHETSIPGSVKVNHEDRGEFSTGENKMFERFLLLEISGLISGV